MLALADPWSKDESRPCACPGGALFSSTNGLGPDQMHASAEPWFKVKERWVRTVRMLWQSRGPSEKELSRTRMHVPATVLSKSRRGADCVHAPCGKGPSPPPPGSPGGSANKYYVQAWRPKAALLAGRPTADVLAGRPK